MVSFFAEQSRGLTDHTQEVQLLFLGWLVALRALTLGMPRDTPLSHDLGISEIQSDRHRTMFKMGCSCKKGHSS